jgi:hypothetical protein
MIPPLAPGASWRGTTDATWAAITLPRNKPLQRLDKLIGLERFIEDRVFTLVLATEQARVTAVVT